MSLLVLAVNAGELDSELLQKQTSTETWSVGASAQWVSPPDAPLAFTLVQQPENENDGDAASRDSRVLQRGDRGRTVVQLQVMLRSLGFYDDAVDGIYGDATTAAVAEFQRTYDLAPVGWVDRSTWSRLRATFEAERTAGTPPSTSGVPDSSSAAPDADAADNSTNADRSLPDRSRWRQRWLPWLGLGMLGVAIAAVAYGLGRWTGGRSRRFILSTSPIQPIPFTTGDYSATEHSNSDHESHRHESHPETNGHSRTLPPSPGAAHADETRPATQEPDASSHQAPIEGAIERTPDDSQEIISASPSPSALVPIQPGESVSLHETPESDPPSREPSTNPSTITHGTPLEASPPAPWSPSRLSKIDIAETLLQDLHSPDALVRRRAIWELGQRGTTDAIRPLVDLLVEVDSQQRSLILAAISEIGVRTLKPLSRALMTSLRDDSSEVRRNAIRDISRVYELMAQVSMVLRHATNDEDESVQETARWALDQLNRVRPAPSSESASSLGETMPPRSLPDASSEAEGRGDLS